MSLDVTVKKTYQKCATGKKKTQERKKKKQGLE